MGGLEGAVDALVQERPQRVVRRHVGGDQGDDRDGTDGQQEPGAQRQVHYPCSGSRSA